MRGAGVAVHADCAGVNTVQEDHEHVWVTALDGDDEPCTDADGRTWQHCGVCSTPRNEKPHPVTLSTPCARPGCAHTLNWHTGGHGCIARGGACPCPAFQPPADPAVQEN